MDRGAHAARRNAVAACLETRSGYKQVGLHIFNPRRHRRGDLVQVFRCVVVPTDNRRHDFRIAGQQLVQETARPHGSVTDFRGDAGVFLAARPPKNWLM
jgi:hypothetical protein